MSLCFAFVTAVQSAVAASEVASPDQPSTSAKIVPGWAELISLPTRSRANLSGEKQKKQRNRLPSYRLTSPEHYSFVSEKTSARNKSCKRQKEPKASVKPKSASCRKRKKDTENQNAVAKKMRKTKLEVKKSDRCQTSDDTPCDVCHIQYGDVADPKKCEMWLQCCSCSVWVHYSCGLDTGIEDDDGSYNCVNCVA